MAMQLLLPDGALWDSAKLVTQPRSAVFHMPNLLSPHPSSSGVKGGCRFRNRPEQYDASTEGITEKHRQELLWRHFFSHPSEWWDERADKESPRHPDFRHKTSDEPIWLSNSQKPPWVDSQLAEWELQMKGSRASMEHSMAQTLRKRCQEANLKEAVAALDALVQGGGHVTTGVFYGLLQRCMAHKNLACGRLVHALALKCGYEGNAFLATHIIRMYASLGELDDAGLVFTKVSRPNLHMWSCIILAHARQGRPAHAIDLYRQFRETGVEPNNHIFVAVLKACASAQDLVSGKEIHGDVQACAMMDDVYIGNCLVSMYAKCGGLRDARKVFDSLPSKNVVTWTAMIAGYTQHGLGQQALALYGSMQQEGISPADHVTFVCLLRACASSRSLQQGKQLHLQLREQGLEGDAVIGNSLVNMYAKCGCLEDARNIFDHLPTRDVVTWNSMIAGCTQQGLWREALDLYASMQHEGITPADHVTFVCLLQACANLGALQQGRELHSKIRATGLESHSSTGNGLVNMYAKCGQLQEALTVFHNLPTKCVVTWTALLNGYAEHGDAQLAIQCFRQMLQHGIQPNETTFLCLLVACSHAGMVYEGQEYFRIMVDDYSIPATDSHYNCMVDLLGRSGHLAEAEHVLQTRSSEQDEVGWKSLLTACRSYGDVERGQRCFDRIVNLAPDHASSYILLENIYADAGRWHDVGKIERLRKSAKAVKKPAKACIEVQLTLHEFTVGETRADLSPTLTTVYGRVKEEGGHIPRTDLVLKTLDEREKERALCGHAEKLALAYGLLNTPQGSPLLVTKNLRMCTDCHSSTKIMSRLEQREIIVRDAHRVHRFVDGSCSCRDRH